MKSRYLVLCLISTLFFGMLILPLIEYADYNLRVIEFEANCQNATDGNQWKNPPVCMWLGGPPENPRLQTFVDELWSYVNEN